MKWGLERDCQRRDAGDVNHATKVRAASMPLVVHARMV